MEALTPLDEYLGRFYDSNGELTSAAASEGYSGVILSQEPDAHAKVLYNKDRLACNAAMLSAPGHALW